MDSKRKEIQKRKEALNIRNKQMIEEIKRSKNLTEVGKKYGISRERVRQISEEAGFNHREYRKHKRYKMQCNGCEKIFIRNHPKDKFHSIKCYRNLLTREIYNNKSVKERRTERRRKYKYVYLGVRNGKQYNKGEHRMIMEKELGRKLKTSEYVFHIDGDPSNNKRENLMLAGHKECCRLANEKVKRLIAKHIKREIKPIILEVLYMSKKDRACL